MSVPPITSHPQLIYFLSQQHNKSTSILFKILMYPLWFSLVVPQEHSLTRPAHGLVRLTRTYSAILFQVPCTVLTGWLAWLAWVLRIPANSDRGSILHENWLVGNAYELPRKSALTQHGNQELRPLAMVAADLQVTYLTGWYSSLQQ